MNDEKILGKLEEILARQEQKAMKMADNKIEHLAASIDLYYDDLERKILRLAQRYEAQEKAKIVNKQRIREKIIQETRKHGFLASPTPEMLEALDLSTSFNGGLE